jgi:hypothetical protein
MIERGWKSGATPETELLSRLELLLFLMKLGSTIGNSGSACPLSTFFITHFNDIFRLMNISSSRCQSSPSLIWLLSCSRSLISLIRNRSLEYLWIILFILVRVSPILLLCFDFNLLLLNEWVHPVSLAVLLVVLVKFLYVRVLLQPAKLARSRIIEVPYIGFLDLELLKFTFDLWQIHIILIISLNAYFFTFH